MVEVDDRPRVSKDMMILQIVRKYPETVGVLREAGLECFNCLMSPFETLEDGASGHGWSPDDVNDLVEKLNRIVEPGGIDQLHDRSD